jgi:hypothetical protein
MVVQTVSAGMAEQLDVGALAPKFAVWTSNLCRVGDNVGLAQFSRRSAFFSYVGVSRACSSHISHDVFSSDA